MSRQSRGGEGYEVRTFGDDLADLSESELQDRAEESLGFGESWFSDGEVECDW